MHVKHTQFCEIIPNYFMTVVVKIVKVKFSLSRQFTKDYIYLIVLVCTNMQWDRKSHVRNEFNITTYRLEP